MSWIDINELYTPNLSDECLQDESKKITLTCTDCQGHSSMRHGC